MQYRQLYTKNGEKEMETLQNSKLNSVWQMCTQHRMYEKKEAKQMSQLVPGMHWLLALARSFAQPRSVAFADRY